VLIISPTKVQARKVAGALKKKGFQGVEFIERADKTPSLLDGLKVLLENGSSNLGWRIVAGELLKDKKDDLKSLLEKNNRDDAPAIQALVSREDKKLTKKMLTVLRNVRDDSPINEPGLSLLKRIGVELHKMGLEALSDELNSSGQIINPGLRQVPIKATTVQGSKGLSADVVFLTHFDDSLFISRSGITDKDVCSFLVALTRAKMKVFLMSSQRKSPTFLKWIDGKRISTEDAKR